MLARPNKLPSAATTIRVSPFQNANQQQSPAIRRRRHQPYAYLTRVGEGTSPARPRKMHLVFDFDGTITERDTISEFAKTAIEHQRSRTGHDLSAQWDGVVRDYVADCRAYNASYKLPESERRSLEDEIDYLAGMRRVETESLHRIKRSGVFAGLDAATLHSMGSEAVASGRIVVRQGFADLVDLADRKGWPVGVISVNWSRAFISGVLHPSKLSVVANEITQDGGVGGPESLGEPLTNSSGKLRVLDGQFSQGSDGVGPVYFGDSSTDLECLLRSGIVMSDSDDSSLIRTLRRLGFAVSHIASAGAGARVGSEGTGHYFWARDFREILDSGLLEH